MPRRRTLSIGTILFAASGWLVSALLLALELPAKINSFMREAPEATKNVTDWALQDREFTGLWTSDLEGWVDATKQELESSMASNGPIVLRVNVYSGVVEGEIASEGLAKSYIYSPLMLEGVKRGDSLQLTVYDFVGGEKVALAELRLSSNKEALVRLPLHLETLRQTGPFFPQKADLWKTDGEEIPGLEGRLNIDLLRKGIGEARKH